MRGRLSGILLGLLAALVTLLAVGSLLLSGLAALAALEAESCDPYESFCVISSDDMEFVSAVFLAAGLAIGGVALFVWLALARRLRAQRETSGHRAARRRAQRVRR